MDSVGELIAKTGIRATPGRCRIMTIFLQHPEKSLSPSEVIKSLIQENFPIGVATVYRTLAIFDRENLINHVPSVSGESFYQLATERENGRNLLICSRCGKTEGIVDSDLERLKKTMLRKSGYQEEGGHALHLYADCRQDDCDGM